MESVKRNLGKVSITVAEEPHSSASEYNTLCIVTNTDHSKIYISRKVVPVGKSLSDTNYWILLLDLSTSVAQINELMQELRNLIEELAQDDIIEAIQNIEKNSLYFKEKYTEYEWGQAENMNNILEDGIYTDCSLGRPETDYSKSLEPGEPNEEIFTLMVLSGRETQSTTVSNGLLQRINNIIQEANGKGTDNYARSLCVYDPLRHVTTGTGNLGSYAIGNILLKETFNLGVIDNANQPIFRFNTNVPNGSYRLTYILDASCTAERDGFSVPTVFNDPYIRIVNNKTGEDIYTGGLNTVPSTDMYKRTSITNVTTYKTINSIQVTDGSLDISIYCTNANYYNWWIFQPELTALSVNNQEYEVINQVCYSHLDGSPYFRPIYSKNKEVPEFPDTIYGAWKSFITQTQLEEITADLTAIKNVIKLDADSDNIVNRLTEVYNLLKNMNESDDLFNIITGINTSITNTNKLAITEKTTVYNKIKVGSNTSDSTNTIQLNSASSSEAGLLSATDKVALDNMYDKYLTDTINPQATIVTNAYTPWINEAYNPTINCKFTTRDNNIPATGVVTFNGNNVTNALNSSGVNYTSNNWNIIATQAMDATLVATYTLNGSKTKTVTKRIVNSPVKKIIALFVTNPTVANINTLTIPTTHTVLNASTKAASPKSATPYSITNTAGNNAALVILVPNTTENANLQFTSGGAPVAMIKFTNPTLNFASGVSSVGISGNYIAYVTGNGTNNFNTNFNLNDVINITIS